MNVLNAVGLDQDFSIDNVDVAVNKKKQQDLSSFLNRSSASEKESQHDKESEGSPAVEDNKEQERHATPEASTSSDFKDLLEMDEEYFDSCGWDDIMWLRDNVLLSKIFLYKRRIKREFCLFHLGFYFFFVVFRGKLYWDRNLFFI